MSEEEIKQLKLERDTAMFVARERLDIIERIKNQKEIFELRYLKADKETERLNNIINEALGIANERFNYYSNHKNNNEEHLEDWKNIFNILLRRDNK